MLTFWRLPSDLRSLTRWRKRIGENIACPPPEVACIAKGNTNKHCEFGGKVSLVLTHSRGLARSAQEMPPINHSKRQSQHNQH